MKEFVEKLIGRLEEQIFSAELYNDEFNGQIVENIICLGDVADTFNQLAEECKYKAIINGQYCWQTCSATEHCKECNRLCNSSIDYYENYDFMAEEHKGGWIPCSERFPEEAAVYEVTEEIFINSKKQYIVEHRLFGTEGEWLCPSNRKVIAWQPLPQTYQPKGE